MARKKDTALADEPLFVVPDCNVLMHGKPLPALPWAEVATSAIEVLLVPTVVREIDSLKTKPGRTGKTARALSAGIRALVGAPDMRAELAKTTAVHWRIVRDRVSELFGNGLDVQHNDDAIINHALSIKAGGARTLFLTGDTIAFVTAQSHGLDSVLMPDHWLKPAEPDEQDKALKLAQAENARLKAAEPQPRLWFADQTGTPIGRLDISLPCYEPLDAALIDGLMERVRMAAPVVEIEVTTFDVADGERDLRKIGEAYEAAIEAAGGFLPVKQSDVEGYQKEYAEWLQQVRTKLARLHLEWRDRRELPAFQMIIANEGNRPAESALFEIEARGAFQIRRPFAGGDAAAVEAKKREKALALPSPPDPPRRRSRLEALMSDHRLFDRSIPAFHDTRLPTFDPPDSDSIYWDNKRGRPADLLSLACGNWRHRRPPDELMVELVVEEDRDHKGAVVGRINANNMTDPLELTLPITISVDARDTARIAENLVDDFERRQQLASKPLPKLSWRLPKKPGTDPSD